MAKKKIRILSLDIAASPGFSVLDIVDGKATLVLQDSIKTSNDFTDSERYAYVEAKTIQIVHEYAPFDYVCREHFLKGGSKRGTQLVFGAWAATDMALAKYGYHIPEDNEVRNSTVKARVGGHGGDKKDVVANGARVVLGLPEDFEWKSYDASDAAAIGFTFAHDKGLITDPTQLSLVTTKPEAAKNGKTTGKTK